MKNSWVPLSEHITAKFPDIGLGRINPSGIPEDLSLQAHHSEDTLDVLITHYSLHN